MKYKIDEIVLKHELLESAMDHQQMLPLWMAQDTTAEAMNNGESDLRLLSN